MKSKKKGGFKLFFDRFSSKITVVTGKPATFITALLLVIVWALTGPLFGFSDTWQLVINTSTTIITFLMVFVIQQSQNKDTVAIHLKLNELLGATSTASNRLISVEDLTEDDLKVLKKFYIKLAALSKSEGDIHATHSIDAAEDNHEAKTKGFKPPEIKKPTSSSQPAKNE